VQRVDERVDPPQSVDVEHPGRHHAARGVDGDPQRVVAVGARCVRNLGEESWFVTGSEALEHRLPSRVEMAHRDRSLGRRWTLVCPVGTRVQTRVWKRTSGGRLLVVRSLTCALLCLLSGAGLGACSDEAPAAAVSAVRLPDNLCAAIPDSVVTRWRLVDVAHETEQGDDRAEARCTMTGRVDEVPVTLDVTLTSYGARDADAARALVAGELAERCAELEASGQGGFTDSERRCSIETGARPGDHRGRVTEVSVSTPSRGLLSVSMAHAGPLWQLVAAEVVGVSGAIANADPADLA
jgi:hypothetical protein